MLLGLTGVNAPPGHGAHHAAPEAQTNEVGASPSTRRMVMVPSKLLTRAAIVVAGFAASGAALAHPGHSHDGWLADVAHTLHALGPLLALLVVGVGAAATYVALDRER
jgi:hypothetical protein